MPLNIIVGLTNLGLAGLIVALSVPLIQGRIKMNIWYGVRLPKSYSSDENWYRINRYGGTLMVKWCAVIAAAGLVSLATPGAIPLQFALLFVAPVTMLVAALQMLVYSVKLPE